MELYGDQGELQRAIEYIQARTESLEVLKHAA